MFCPNCGSTLNDGATFCPSCGTRVGSTQAPATQASQPMQIQPAAQPYQAQYQQAAQP